MIMVDNVKANNLSSELLERLGIFPNAILKLAIEVKEEAKENSKYDEWDLQMIEDSNAGKFDAITEQAWKEFEAGKCEEWP